MLHEMLALVRVVTPSEKRAVMTLGGVKFMFRFLRITNGWRLPWQGFEACGRPNGSMAASGQRARRSRSRRHPVMESVEARILLSSFDVKSARAVTRAEVFLAKKSPVQITAVSGFGVKGGQAYLTATLTSGGAPLAGKTIYFQVKGRMAGTAVTDSEGVAMRYLGNMRNVKIGVFAQGVGAGFAGDSTHKSLIAHGKLTVSSLPGTISGVSASGVYDGFGSAAATLTSRGTPLPGMTIQFQVMGHVVGTAVTNSQGVATLGNVSLVGLNAGSYANAVTANFAGSLTYTQGGARECRGRA